MHLMAIDSYDPLNPPDPVEWMALDSEARVALVRAYHHSIGDRGENEQLHCTLHAIVENQVAMDATMEPVRERLRQLMAQGLDRHHAVHAIAIVVSRHMYRVSRNTIQRDDQTERYFRELRRMNARKYMAMTT
jgi:hypothetical protein